MTGQVKFMHLRGRDLKGGVTVAYTVDTEKKIVSYNIARCNPCDNFVRRVGRDKAGGRLLGQGALGTFNFVEYPEIKQYFVKLFHPDTVNVPREEATQYLTAIHKDPDPPVVTPTPSPAPAAPFTGHRWPHERDDGDTLNNPNFLERFEPYGID